MPEIIPVISHVHFKCAFDVSSASISPLMTHLRQALRSWCIKRAGTNDPTLHGHWFYVGNNPKKEPAQYVINGCQIRTVSAPSQDPQEPSCWALELIHSDAEEKARRWSVEVALRKNDDGTVRFTSINKHWMIPYFIGEYPDPPADSVPGYVRSLLSDPRITCKRGDAVLLSRSRTVVSTNVRSVYDQLVSPERQVPFIFVAGGPGPEPAAIEPNRIADTVLGNANVYLLDTPSVVDEMNYYLDNDIRCESRMIRVYVPGLVVGDRFNSRLHRYMTGSAVAEQGEATALRFLANGLARNGIAFRLNDLTSFQHIFTERRRYAIKNLAAKEQAGAEERVMVWEENEKLVAQVSELEGLAIRYESENETLSQENGTLRFRVEEAERVRHRISDLEGQVAGMQALSALPTNLSGILTAMAALFPQRIAVAGDAIRSASEYTDEHGGHWGKPEQLTLAWAMVFDLATKLYEIVFVEGQGDYEGAFNGKSQFGLAISEGRQTKKDTRLMNLRKIVHDGAEFDITAHLKYGNKPPKLLRLHFAIDRGKKRLVVGHFGEHLENYSSRNQH